MSDILRILQIILGTACCIVLFFGTEHKLTRFFAMLGTAYFIVCAISFVKVKYEIAALEKENAALTKQLEELELRAGERDGRAAQ